MFFFSWIFFPQEHKIVWYQIVAGGNSQFVDIKFTVLPFPPSWKKVSIYVLILIFVKWLGKLSDLLVFQSGNHRGNKY